MDQLCKALLFEDTNNGDYYLAIVQYVAKINTDKLISTISKLNRASGVKNGEGKEKKKPTIKIADEMMNDELTGFKHNAVSPLGLRRPEKIQVLVSEACVGVNGGYLYLGAGCEHTKLGISVEDLIAVTDAEIGDYSEARVDFDDNTD